MSYALARPVRLDLEAFARATATHPDLIRRLVALGLLEADRDAAGDLWFAPSQVAASCSKSRRSSSVSLAGTMILTSAYRWPCLPRG